MVTARPWAWPGRTQGPAEMEAASPNQPSDDDEKAGAQVGEDASGGRTEPSGSAFHLTKARSPRGMATCRATREPWGRRYFPNRQVWPKGRFFLSVHFGDVDVNGHKYGESSPEYDGALVSLDTCWGEWWLNSRPTGSTTTPPCTSPLTMARRGNHPPRQGHQHLSRRQRSADNVSGRATRHHAHCPAGPGRGPQHHHAGLASKSLRSKTSH